MNIAGQQLFAEKRTEAEHYEHSSIAAYVLLCVSSFHRHLSGIYACNATVSFFASIEKFCKKLRTDEHRHCRSTSLQVNCYILLCVFVFVEKRTSAQKHEHCRSEGVQRKMHKTRTTRTQQRCRGCVVWVARTRDVLRRIAWVKKTPALRGGAGVAMCCYVSLYGGICCYVMAA